MRYALILLLLAALVLEVAAIYWINGEQPPEPPPTTPAGPKTPLETGEVSIGDQMAAREKRLAAEKAEPVWPLNPDKGDRVIRGFVFRYGKPVVGAAVTVDQRPLAHRIDLRGFVGSPRWTDTTGAAGYFEVDTLPEGAFVVTARHDDGLAVDRVELDEATHAHEAALSLMPAPATHGVVVAEQPAPAHQEDAARDAALVTPADRIISAQPSPSEPLAKAEASPGPIPVEGALVFPIVRGDLAQDSPLRLLGYIPTRTDAEGRFTFTHMPAPCRFVVSAPNHDPWVSPTVPPGANDIRLVLASGAAVPGQVLRAHDGAPQPVSHVDVRLVSARLPIAPEVAFTDSDGRFTFTGLPAGAYTFAMHSDKFHLRGEAPVITTWPDKQHESVTLHVAQNVALRGRITWDNGKPYRDVVVRVRAHARNVVRRAKTDRAGNYHVTGLPPGPCTVDVLGLGGFTTDPPNGVEVAAGPDPQTPGPTFTVHPEPGMGTVHCTVTDAGGTRIAGAAVHYYAQPGNDATAPADARIRGVGLSDGDGHYLWKDVPRNWECWVYASTPEAVSTPAGWFSLGERDDAAHTLVANVPALGSIAGNVYDRLDRPVTGMAVSVLPGDLDPAWPLAVTGYTGPDGKFALAGVPAGSLRLRVGTGLDARGKLQEVKTETSVAVAPDQSVTGLRLILK
ncbi:MAG: carboxypeptidase regulatory-like domain-containing protein [Candidatus Hydrogenedentota bacterium]